MLVRRRRPTNRYLARLLRDIAASAPRPLGAGTRGLFHAIDPQAAPRTPGGRRRRQAGESSPLAAVQLFVRLLGRFAGGLALTFKAFGGVYRRRGRGSGHCSTSANFATPSKRIRRMRNSCAQRPLLMHRTKPGLLGCAAGGQMAGDDAIKLIKQFQL